MDDSFEIADRIIGNVYPDFNHKGRGWWGDKRIPNHGILRGSISAAIVRERKRMSATEDKECACTDKDAVTCASRRDKKYGLHHPDRKCPCFCHLESGVESETGSADK